MTHANGSYRVHLADREGRYRAKAMRFEPSSGNVCEGTTSRIKRHR